MKAIVHIGAPKTGSSSIQEFLFANTQALARQGFRFHRNLKGRGSQLEYPLAVLTELGLLVPGATERIRYNARTLDEQAAASQPHVDTLKRYPQTWREPVALFSSEHFLPWLKTPEAVEVADRMFRDVFDEVRYIVYFRRPVDAIVSQYSERTKRGYSTSIDQFIKQRRASGSLGIFKPAKRWVDVVGADRLTVRVMSKAHFRNGDLIDDFCDACGIDPAGLERPPRVNESLTASGAECLRALNAKIPELHPDGGLNPLRAHLLDAVVALSAEGPKLQLNERQARIVARSTERGNRLFQETFFPDDPDLFDGDGALQAGLSEREVKDMALDLMTELIIQLRLGDIPALSRRDRRQAFHIPAEDQLTPTA